MNRLVLELARLLLPLLVVRLARWLVARVNRWLLEKIDDALVVET